MKYSIYVFILIPLTYFVLVSCKSNMDLTKQNKKVNEKGDTLYYKKVGPIIPPDNTDRYQRTISGLKEKYGHLRVYPIHPPEQYGDDYFTKAMERFEALLPNYFYKENPRLYSGMNNPKLTTAGDFKKCTYILVPVYTVTANAFEFTDLTTQKATDFLNLYTKGCIVLIKKGREIIEVSALFLKPSQSNIGCFSRETEGKVETIRYFNEARLKSDRFFAITGPSGGIGYPILGYLDKGNKGWVLKPGGYDYSYINKETRSAKIEKYYYQSVDPNYGLLPGQYLSVFLENGLPGLERNRQGK